jgi:5-amino-6-(5-phosphoribosylamino)uracil reductase
VRPYTLLSCAVSLDGYLDDASEKRLVLSNAADLDEVDEVRAGCDAILVGANTIRRDNPRLLVRAAHRRNERVGRGLPPSPVKVALTSTGDLDPAGQFCTAGESIEKLIYCATPVLGKASETLASLAAVIDGGEPLNLHRIVDDLGERGIRRLLVEGGEQILTGFLAAGLADELRLAVAPFLVGDSRAPRFTRDAAYPWRPDRPARLVEVRRIGDLAVLRYALSARFPG